MVGSDGHLYRSCENLCIQDTYLEGFMIAICVSVQYVLSTAQVERQSKLLLDDYISQYIQSVSKMVFRKVPVQTVFRIVSAVTIKKNISCIE